MFRLCFGTVIVVVLLKGGVAAADEQAEAKAILEQAIKAHGGESTLGKFIAMHFKVKGTGYEGDKKTAMNFEWFFQGTEKMRTVSFDDETKTESVEVVNGKEGWAKDGAQSAETLSSDQVASRREIIYVNWITTFVPLRGKEFRLSSLDDISVAGRKAVGIRVSHDKHDPVKLYFDKESHLFVKYERQFNNVEAGKVFKEESLYSGYRTIQGTMQPMKVETYWDGVKVSDLAVVEAKLQEQPLDEKLFSKP